MRTAPVIGALAAWGASGLAVALLGLGVPFAAGQIASAIIAGLAIWLWAKPRR